MENLQPALQWRPGADNVSGCANCTQEWARSSARQGPVAVPCVSDAGVSCHHRGRRRGAETCPTLVSSCTRDIPSGSCSRNSPVAHFQQGHWSGRGVRANNGSEFLGHRSHAQHGKRREHGGRVKYQRYRCGSCVGSHSHPLLAGRWSSSPNFTSHPFPGLIIRVLEGCLAALYFSKRTGTG